MFLEARVGLAGEKAVVVHIFKKNMYIRSVMLIFGSFGRHQRHALQSGRSQFVKFIGAP